MKKTMLRLLGSILILALVAGACTRKEDPEPDPTTDPSTEDPTPDPPTPSEYLGDENDQTPFEEKQLPVLRDGAPAGSVAIRFYADKPSIPYISVADFQSMMLPGSTMNVTMTQDGQYTLENRYSTATVSTTRELLTCENYLAFTNVMELSQPGMDNAPYDSFPMVRYVSQESSAPKAITFDFNFYGIDLRGNATAVYFPFATLADLYADLYFHYAACNKEKVVIASRDGDDYSIDVQAPEFSHMSLLATPRTEDMVAYTYAELCFVVDYFYGMPGRSPFEQSIGSVGLDKTLEASDAGKQVKSLLLSTNPLDFGAGMQYLMIFLYDGGHSKTWTGPELVLNDQLPYVTQYPELLLLFSQFYYSYEIKKVYGREMVTGDRVKVFPDNATYHKVGDTAICHFDDFHFIDHAAWNAYYAGTGELPTLQNITQPDRPAIFLDALKKAQDDPEVKNFVLDLTLNNGGSLDLVIVLTSLLYDETLARGYSPLTGEYFQWNYQVDRNLDRVFDDKDKEVQNDLNVCILTSRFSFSCGNALPSLCKDAGILIAGETSGGGGCAVAMFRTPEGYPYRISSARARLCGKDGENIDPGITPHVAIEYTADNSLDFGGSPVVMPGLLNFYDLEYLSGIIHEYYQK